jgi:hypothetical protein
MLQEKLLEATYRLKLITELKSSENRERLENSQEEWDVYTGNIKPYVKQKIADRFSADLVKEVPIVSAINVLKKVVDSRASLYKSEPKREYTDLSDEQKEAVNNIYDNMRMDFSMLEANKLYELQKHQTHLLIEPKKGRLRIRPIKAHQVNVVPDELDPEEGEIYIFSSYNKDFNQNADRVTNKDSINQSIADYDDYEAQEERYVVWSSEYHFVMDGNGAIISEDIVNPIAPIMPVVEISAMKDFNYWRELTNDVAEFCVDYNMHQSMLGQIVEMQGFAQAYLKAPSDLMPDYVEIGANRILKLITNPQMEGDVEFGYANPNSDIASAQAYNEAILAQFLSSQGLDSNAVSGTAKTDKYTSGTERLLAQVERFEASKETMAIFREAEQDVYEVIKAWHNELKKTDIIDPRFVTADLPESSEALVTYEEPKTDLTMLEMLDIAERRLEIDWSLKDAKAYLDDMSVEQAEEKLKEEGLMNVEVEVVDEQTP